MMSGMSMDPTDQTQRAPSSDRWTLFETSNTGCQQTEVKMISGWYLDVQREFWPSITNAVALEQMSWQVVSCQPGIEPDE